jgi:hypothetical protein
MNIRDNGTEGKSFSALYLCAFVTLCLHDSVEIEVKASPEGEGSSPLLLSRSEVGRTAALAQRMNFFGVVGAPPE